MTSMAPGVITCKAAVIWELGGQVKVEEVKVDPPQAGEVRIKMLCASICHTDVLCCKGFPIVQSIGEEVGGGLKQGDIVIPLYLGECGQCLNCKTGRTNLCHTYPPPFSGLMNDGTSRMSVAKTGQRLYHFTSCSTWSEYTVVNFNYVLKIDPNMPLPMPVSSRAASPRALVLHGEKPKSMRVPLLLFLALAPLV
ncbi:hypothetical protein L1987_33176 [Smallanthus sonchifolius]|uniref:Uncharacterized protein n=1 Tax=Smallanthus sonchifolius TaxID=185202 RepID=A0ACB9HQL8_9ASTR|nr:hypothetical protein L1987_33176 [Smallanthus sonchifolius]